MHRTASIAVTLREEAEYRTLFTINIYFGGIEVMHHERGPEYGGFWRIKSPTLHDYHRERQDHSSLP